MDDYHKQVEELKEKGYTVKFYHYRMPQPGTWLNDVSLYPSSQDIKYFVLCNALRYYRRSKNNFKPYECGGVTECIVCKDDKIVLETQAVCSLSDNFNYRRGVRISLGRARKRLVS